MSAAFRMERLPGNNRHKQVMVMPMPTKVRHLPTGVTARVMFGLLWLLCTQLMTCTPALAWTPFERKTLYEEVELSAAEAKKVQYAAGWSAQSDTELLVEIKNNLPGPLACHGATVHLLSGTTVSKSFLPRLYVPNATSRQGAGAGIAESALDSPTLIKDSASAASAP
jgi:hypothetical protein